jgi:hypothetical protein
MSECDRFPAGSRQRSICEGTADLPLYKINKQRERWGYPPLTEDQIRRIPESKSPRIDKPNRPVKLVNNARKKRSRPLSKARASSGGCSSCGGRRQPKPAKPNGYGPGSQLLKMFDKSGVPHCQACIDMAATMDIWGKSKCKQNIEIIIDDILPRARSWMADNQSFIHTLFSIPLLSKIEDAALRIGIKQKVVKAIELAGDKPIRQRKRKHPIQQVSLPPSDKSNLISSTAIGEPTWQIGEYKTVEQIPFSREPIKNLIYHIYPNKCDNIWKRNLDLLLEYIDIFDGRRVVAITIDSESDDAKVVQDYLAGVVIELMVFRNNSRVGEMTSFIPLLSQIESYNPNEITFRAHAKGVHRYCKDKKAPHLMEWVEMLYRTNLRFPEIVKDQLTSTAMTGSCRKFDMFDKKQSKVSYSGSFYWFRNIFTFSREWYNVDSPRWGCESWPGKIFTKDETSCLFLDEAKSMYSPIYWTETVKPQYEKWLINR